MDNSKFTIGSSGHIGIQPRDGAHYKTLNATCGNTDSTIISTALPITVNTMSNGTGNILDINSGYGMIVSVVLNN